MRLKLAGTALPALLALSLASPGGAAPEGDLREAVERVDAQLVKDVEANLRRKLDAGAAQQLHGYLPGGDLTPGRPWVRVLEDGTRRLLMKYGHQALKAAEFLIASEVLGEPKYREVGLKCCDFLLKAQQPRGHWLSQYYVSPTGEIRGAPGGEPERLGLCRVQDGFQDENVFALIYAYRLSGKGEYLDAAKRSAECLLSIQNQNGTWPDYWDFDLPRDQGPATGVEGVRLGCSYNDGATTRPIQVMILLYHLTHDRRYLDRLDRLAPWIDRTQLGKGKVRGWCQQYGLDGKPIQAREFEMPVIELRTFDRAVFPLLLWLHLAAGEGKHMRLIRETYDWMKSVEQKEGWAYQYQPDGAEVFSIGYKTYRYDQPDTWPDGKNPYPYSREKVNLAAVPGVLDVYGKGGWKALRAHFAGKTQLSPAEYGAARLAAAKAAAATRREEITTRRAVLEFLYSARLATGEIPPEAVAMGGHGLLSLEPGMLWHNRVWKVADWFDLPIGR